MTDKMKNNSFVGVDPLLRYSELMERKKREKMSNKVEIKDLTDKTVIETVDMNNAKRKLENKVHNGIEDESEKLVNNVEVIKANLRDKTTSVVLDNEELNSLDIALNDIIDAATKLKALLGIAEVADIEL